MLGSTSVSQNERERGVRERGDAQSTVKVMLVGAKHKSLKQIQSVRQPYQTS